MIENIRSLPVEELVAGVSNVATIARDADAELTLALTYAHRVMSPPLSLRVLSRACGLSPSTIRARVHAPGVMETLRDRLDGTAAAPQTLPGDMRGTIEW